RQKDHGELPDVAVQTGVRELLACDGVRLTEDVQAVAGDGADDADAEPRAGERLPPHDLGRQASCSPSARTSSLNRLRSGSTSLNWRSSGRPPTLWCDLMLAAPVPPPDSTTSG